MSPHAAPEVLWLYLFDKEGSARAVAAPDLTQLTLPDEGWLWLHLPLSDNRCRIFLQQFTHLSEEVKEVLLGPERSPRFFGGREWSYGVAADFERDLSGAPTIPGRLRFAFAPNFLITLRRHALYSIDHVRRDIDDGEALPSPIAAMEAMSSHYCAAVGARLRDLADDLDRTEDRILEDASGLDEINLGPVRRQLSRIHRELIAARGAIHQMAQQRDKLVSTALAEAAHRMAQKLEDVDREASALQDRGRLLHDEVDTLVTGATNRALRALTIVSTLLLPPTVIVGAFGMNLQGIPFANSPSGFLAASLVCVVSVIAAIALLWRLRVFD